MLNTMLCGLSSTNSAPWSSLSRQFQPYYLPGDQIVEGESGSAGKLGDLDSYEIKGAETKGEILQNLAEFKFSYVLFSVALKNACSELGVRMSAMDSSSRNAGQMPDRHTLTYNRTRQASITMELIEIISGALALTG